MEENAEKINYTVVFGKFLRQIEVLVKEHKPTISGAFGPNGLFVMLQKIHETSEKFSSNFLIEFQKDWKFSVMVLSEITMMVVKMKIIMIMIMMMLTMVGTSSS